MGLMQYTIWLRGCVGFGFLCWVCAGAHGV